MALVNVLQFSPDTGAIISDEEFWNVHFRKRLYADNLASLLDDRMANDWRMEAVYGGVGYPSLHHEIVELTKTRLQATYATGNEGTGRPVIVKEVARTAFECLQEMIRRRIDQKLVFFFGFNADDLTRGYYLKNGKRIDISNKKVKEGATAILTGDKADVVLKAAMQSKAVVFGFDDTYGITMYHLSIENWVMGYVHEGFEAIGAGKYASGLILGQDFKTKTFAARKAGYSVGEGILELFESAVLATDHFKEVGGNFNLIFLDRQAGQRATRIIELRDHEARLATEITRAVSANLLQRETAWGFLEDLLWSKKPWQAIDTALFASVTDSDQLHFLLRRYKMQEVIEIAAQSPTRSVTKGLEQGGTQS